ncbi:hypothetical protein GCM10010259_11570 [Streptomyces daghestanicus]|nr:hypothetical protein GCM10010259_11570 [Streptomyces daghestanicus]
MSRAVRAVFATPPSGAGRASLFPFAADGAALVADLRLTRAAYPGEKEIEDLVEEARRAGAGFGELWATATLGTRLGGTKRVRHPLVGELVLDSDVLKVPDHDMRIMTFTAEPGTPDAEGPDRLRAAAEGADVSV